MDNSQFYENDITRELNKQLKEIQKAACPHYTRELNKQLKEIQEAACPPYIRKLNNQFNEIQNTINIFQTIPELSHLQKCIQETNLYFEKLKIPIQNSIYQKIKLSVVDSYLRNINYISLALNQLANINFQVFQSNFNLSDVNDLKSKIHLINKSENSDTLNMSDIDVEKTEKNYEQIVYIIENINVYLSTDDKVEVPKKSNTIFKKLVLILSIIGYFNTVIAFQINVNKITEIFTSQVKQSVNESSTSSSSIEIADSIKSINKDK